MLFHLSNLHDLAQINKRTGRSTQVYVSVLLYLCGAKKGEEKGRNV